MKICGLQKTTLLDFPGRVAATIFTGGCNFRCPFCHNSGLLGSDAEEYECQEDILAFLENANGYWKVFVSPEESPPCSRTWRSSYGRCGAWDWQ